MIRLSLLQLGILYSLISVFSWGIGDFVSAILSRKFNVVTAVFWVEMISFLALSSYVIFTGTKLIFTFPVVILATLAGFCFSIGTSCFYQGLRIGKICLVSPISASYSIILVLASLILYQESLSLVQGIAITSIILGTVLAATNLSEIIHSKQIFSDPGIPFALLTLLFWGLGYLFINPAIARAGWITPNLIMYITISICVAIYSFTRGTPIIITHKLSQWLLLFIAGLLSAGGYLGYSLGIETTLVSLVGPLTASYPAITVVLGWLFFKEELVPNQIIGILAIIGGTIILGS